MAPRTAFGVRLQELCTSHAGVEDVLNTAGSGAPSQPPSPLAGQVCQWTRLQLYLPPDRVHAGQMESSRR